LIQGIDVDRRTRELEILNKIAEALNATNDVRRALEQTLAMALDLLKLRSGWVWLLDPETNQFFNAAAYNLPPYLQEPIRMTGSWCVCTEALRSGDLMSKNVDVIECSRLNPAVRKRATDLTAGLRYHASVPLRFAEKPLGVLNVTGPAWRKLTKDELALLSTIALQISAMIERSRLAEEEARVARSAERSRLGREIHDTLLQGLTALGLQLEDASRHAEDTQALRNRFERMLETIRTTSSEARRAVADLRAAPLADRPLPQALNALARGFMSDTGVTTTVRAPANLALPSRTESELFRIAQEALTNVAKHADARSVAIDLRRMRGKLELRVTDDGRGYSPDGSAGRGHGVASMSERAALVGGICSVRRQPKGGTVVTVSIPAVEQPA
jgi:two-component system, NarL family, sensor kinase